MSKWAYYFVAGIVILVGTIINYDIVNNSDSGSGRGYGGGSYGGGYGGGGHK